MEMANNPGEGTGLSVAEVTANIEKLWDSENGTTESVDADNDSETIDLTTEEAAEEEQQDEQPETDSETETSESEEPVESKDEAQEAEAKAAREAEIVFDFEGKPISRKEAELGYMRQADYTKKTQELKSNMGRYLVQEQSKEEYRVGLEQQLGLMAAQMSQVAELVDMPSDDLLRDDPQAFLIQQRKFEKQQAAIKHLRDEHAGVIAKIEQSRKEQDRKSVE